MIDKCNICKYSDIDHVICYDMLLDKCITCDIFKTNIYEFKNIVRNYIYLVNYENIRSYEYLSPEDETYKKIEMMISLFDYENFNEIKSEKFCNICREKLTILKNKDFNEFEIYLCPFCYSIYFNKKNFENAFNKFIKIVNRRSKIKRIINKIIGLFKRR